MTERRNWPLGSSTIAIKNFKPENLKFFQAAGIRAAEIVISSQLLAKEPAYWNTCFSALKMHSDIFSVQIWSIQLPSGQSNDISSLDEQERISAVFRQGFLIQRAAAVMGIKKAVIRPSSEPIKDRRRPARLDAAKKSLQVLCSMTPKGTQIAIENLPRTALGNCSDEMELLLQADDRLGICCDMNHMLRETTEQFLEKCARKVVTVHISDYDRTDEKHWLPIPGRGINDWERIFTLLEEADYDGPAMYEAGYQNVGTLDNISNSWNMLLEGNIPGEVAPEDPILEEVLFKENVSEKITAEEVIQDETIPEEAVLEETLSKEPAPENTAPENTVLEETATQDNFPDENDLEEVTT